MGSARAGLVVLVLLGILVFADWGVHQSGTNANSSPGQDASLVYCLDPAHQGSLVTAAVTLGLAGTDSTPAALTVHGRTLALPQWRIADSADFTRACDAYAAASVPGLAASDASGSGDSAGTSDTSEQLLDVLLPVIAGALLTMAADYFKQAGDQRIALGDELRASWLEFESAVKNYLADSVNPLATGRPLSSDLDAKRRVLGADLRNISLRYPKSRRVDDLRKMLKGDYLGPRMTEGGLVAKAQQVEDTLVAFNDSLDQVASRLERAIWAPVRL
jgi:hypothetical protein